ncbi:MAG TPA: helix-turn-helix transcriptional regulator [Pseudonocardiaceae bacterium]|nr:helix-turn-helix transcriptional regulator [Pseudonocardiaceae bacterium]
MDVGELGPRLRAERVAGGRTIASVAADAGLSVPYIANLENGRGNPTLSAMSRLAEALHLRLAVDLVADEPSPPAGPTDSVLRFARTARFRDSAARLAAHADVPDQTARQRLLTLLTAGQSAAGTELSPTDHGRFLDALLLTTLTTG